MSGVHLFVKKVAACLLGAILTLSAHPEESAPASTPVHHPLLQGAPNFRDLGGYRTSDGRIVKSGALYRSDALNELTPQDMQYIEKLGIRKIVDFRSANERSRNPDKLPPDLAAVTTPLPLGEDGSAEDTSHEEKAAKAFNALSDAAKLKAVDHFLLTDAYPAFVHTYTPVYRAWIHGLLDDHASTQVFHCTGGADRTGFAAAILLLALGVPRDQIMRDYLLTNQLLFTPRGRFYLDRRMQMKLPSSMKLRADYLNAAFNTMVSDYGTVEGYLRDGLGVDDQFRLALRQQYLE